MKNILSNNLRRQRVTYNMGPAFAVEKNSKAAGVFGLGNGSIHTTSHRYDWRINSSIKRSMAKILYLRQYILKI